MFGITDIWAYLIGVIIIILLPGPNSLYCLSISAANGIKAGYQVVWGIILGDGILMFLAVVGVGALLKVYPSIFVALKLLGGLYLAYLGIKILISAYQSFTSKTISSNNTNQDTQINTTQNNQQSHQKYPYFYRSLILSLTNPKAILFFLSFFIGFVNPTYANPALSFTILGLILQIVSFSYLSILVLFGANLIKKFSGKKWLEVGALSVVGLLFIGFAINLWGATITN